MSVDKENCVPHESLLGIGKTPTGKSLGSHDAEKSKPPTSALRVLTAETAKRGGGGVPASVEKRSPPEVCAHKVSSCVC